MGMMDVFGAETRVEITVRELIALLDEKAKAEADFNAAMVMLREGVDPETVRAVFGLEKGKEPAAAATATDSREITVQVKDSTKTAESQALRGVNVLGVLECALDNAYGSDAEIMSLRTDSDTASIVFRYGGTAYSVQFGLAF